MATYNWAENVHIFKEKIEKIDIDEKTHIYGYGFRSFYMEESQINKIKIKEKEEINILLTHASIDSITDATYNKYNPMPKSELKKLGFNYIALGHIHKPYYNEEENQTIIYPGSTISLGFDELGKHGMVVGEIDEEQKLKIQFIPLDKKEFIETKLEVTTIFSIEELIEKINTLQLEQNKFYKIILTGERNFEINTNEIQKHIDEKIIKIKNTTKIKQNLQEIAKQNTLKGIFVKNMLKKIEQYPEQAEKLEKAIEIGLQNM